MAKTQHVHKLKRHRFKTGNTVYFCALPECNFKIAPALALGKRAICWRCENEFILNEYSIRLAKPHCDDCHKSKNPIDPELPGPLVSALPESVPVFPSNVSSLRDRLNAASAPVEDEDI